MQDKIKKTNPDRPMLLSSLNIVVFKCMGQFAHAPPDVSYKKILEIKPERSMLDLSTV